MPGVGRKDFHLGGGEYIELDLDNVQSIWNVMKPPTFSSQTPGSLLHLYDIIANPA